VEKLLISNKTTNLAVRKRQEKNYLSYLKSSQMKWLIPITIMVM